MDKEDGVHIYNGLLLSHYKEWNKAIWSNTDEPRECHTECRQKEEKYSIPYILNLKGNDTNDLTRQKDLQT